MQSQLMDARGSGYHYIAERTLACVERSTKLSGSSPAFQGLAGMLVSGPIQTETSGRRCIPHGVPLGQAVSAP